MILSNIRSRFRVPRPEAPEGTVIYAIGDIHGRADLLKQALDKIERDKERTAFDTCVEVYLGDYVDRGPDSKSVIDLLIQRRRDVGAVTLRGNHESIMMTCLDDPAAIARWCNLGGLETIESYGVPLPLPLPDSDIDDLHAGFVAAVPASHRAFLSALQLSYSCGDYFFAHAGVRPGVPLDRQTPQDLMWIRDDFLGSTRWHGKYIVHGHTPKEKPDLHRNRAGIDTGAYMTGNLTCLKLFSDQQSVL